MAGIITPDGNGTRDLGTSSLRFKDIYASNNVIQTSDARMKKGVKNSDLGLDFITQIRPVSYYWIEGDKQLHYGVLAQETEKALANAKKKSGRENEVDNVIVTYHEVSDRYGVRYTELIAPVIKAIQELYAAFTGVKSDVEKLKADNAMKDRSIASLKSQTEKLEEENKAMKNRLDQIEKKLNSK